MSEFQITKKSVDYNMRKSAKIGVFLALGHIWPLKWDVLAVKANWLQRKGLNGCSWKNLAKIMSEFQITKKCMDYSTRKSAKWGVYLLWGTFDLQNGTFWPWGLTGSIAKRLTDVHEINWQKLCRNFRSPKCPWSIAHDNRQNEGFTWSGADLTLKMGWFGRDGKVDP